MAESNGLLNRRRRDLTAGSNPALSAIFFAKKKWRTKPQGFSSLSRQAQLHLKNEVFSSHLHQIPEALLVKSLHFIPLVKTFRLRSTCEVFSLREYGWCSLYFALRLHGGVAALNFTFTMLY